MLAFGGLVTNDNGLSRFRKGVALAIIGFWMANVTVSAIPTAHYTPPIYVHWFCGIAVMAVFGFERVSRWWRGGGGPDVGA